MAFSNSKMSRFFSLFGVGSLIIIISSCGSTARLNKQEKAKPKKENTPYPIDNPVLNSSGEPTSPTTKALILPMEKGAEAVSLVEDGKASWYGPNFHGKLTANGEKYDMYGMTAAHRTLPFNTLVLVENEDSGKSVVVRVNDRGPFAKNRIIDLSKKAAQEIGMIGPGTAHVKLYVAKKALDKSKGTDLKVATYTVQLGSFKTEAKAFNYSSKIKGSRVEIVRNKNKKTYRVYYGIFIDKHEASQKQKELERKNYSGYVKQIENG